MLWHQPFDIIGGGGGGGGVGACTFFKGRFFSKCSGMNCLFFNFLETGYFLFFLISLNSARQGKK